MEMVVVADDRSGAIETAGAMADGCGAAIPVVTTIDDLVERGAARLGVLDLASRPRDPDRAAALAAAIERSLADVDRQAHKIDSTMRGNWAHELVARHSVGRRPVLVVPALPALGRTCVGGVLLHDGRPVHDGPSGADIGRRTRSSRPDDHLRHAGAGIVASIPDVGALDRWWSSPTPFAVCDVVDEAQLTLIASRWVEHPSVLLAGTSAVVAAAARAAVGPVAPAGPPLVAPPIAPPIVVVCGSLHTAARAQLGRLGEVFGARRDVLIVATDATDVVAEAVDSDHAADAAARLARSAHDAVRTRGARTVVVIGGDTAAAFLGARSIDVGGTVAPGTAWCRARGNGPLTIVRSGGFGGPDALVDLVSGTLAT